MRNKLLVSFISVIGIVVVLFGSIACYASEQIDYPSFPGFPEGMERAEELGTGSQWIDNTPYGGITVDPENSYAFLRMERVHWLPGQVQYNFSLINTNSSAINCKVVCCYDLGDYIFPKYVFRYDFGTDIASYAVGVGSYTSSSVSHRWITDPFNSTSSTRGYYFSTGRFSVPSALVIEFQNVEPGSHSCWINFGLYPNSYYVDENGSDLGFWGLGRDTDLTSVNSAISSLVSPQGSGGIGTVISTLGYIISHNAYIYLLLWVLVILNVIDIVLGWANNL